MKAYVGSSALSSFRSPRSAFSVHHLCDTSLSATRTSRTPLTSGPILQPFMPEISSGSPPALSTMFEDVYGGELPWHLERQRQQLHEHLSMHGKAYETEFTKQ